MRVGDGRPRPTRVAISEREDVPNLLGRLDVFDSFQVDFDPSLQETRITPPWLDAGQRTLWRHFLEVERTILAKWGENPLPGRADEAAQRFVSRGDQLAAAGAGLLKLHRGFELPLIIRALFELAVQFEYLMLEPGPRSDLYLDYQYVTKFRSMQAWLRFPGPLGDDLRTSPDRVAGEPRNRADYERVRGRYAVRSKNNSKAQKERAHWYPGNLRQLAEAVDRAEEYGAVYGMYSAWAHGDPWTAGLGHSANAGLMHVLTYWGRLLIQVADAKKIILTGDAYDSLRILAKGPLGD